MINFDTPPQVQGAITVINSAVEVVVVGEYQVFFLSLQFFRSKLF